MAKLTIVFAILLAVLAAAGYFCPKSDHVIALTPLWFGIVLGIGGYLARGGTEARKKTFLYIDTAIGVVGFLFALRSAINTYGSARTEGVDPNLFVIADRLVMAAILLVFLNFAVQAILKARQPSEE
jgi:hypothetical protein